MTGKTNFPNTDWRFNEFPNPSAHMLYVTCVELMALPLVPSIVGNNLLDIVCKGFIVIPSNQLQSWINSVGLVMAALPDSYWSVLHDRITEVITCPQMLDWKYSNTPFQLFNLVLCNNALLENKFSLTLALAHSTWYHAGIGQIAQIPQLVSYFFSLCFCLFILINILNFQIHQRKIGACNKNGNSIFILVSFGWSIFATP